jgi:hypothetical protein
MGGIMRSVWHLLFLDALTPLAWDVEIRFANTITPRYAPERRPFDLAHWTPNMPRGHESI